MKLAEHIWREIRDALTELYTQRLRAIQRELQDYAELLYDDTFNSELRTLLAQVPSQFLSHYTSLTYSIEECAFDLTYSQRVGPKKNNTWDPIVLERDNCGLFDELHELVMRRKELYRERDQLIDQVHVLYSACTTFDQLLQAWPSAIEHVGVETRRRYQHPEEYLAEAAEERARARERAARRREDKKQEREQRRARVKEERDKLRPNGKLPEMSIDTKVALIKAKMVNT